MRSRTHLLRAPATTASPGPAALALDARERRYARAPIPQTWALPRALVILVLALSVGGAVCAGSARAGTLGVVSCKDPVSGAVEPTEGWVTTWAGTPQPGAGDVNECTTGGTLESFVDEEVAHTSSTGPVWEYAPPAGDTIVGGQLSTRFYVPGSKSNKFGGQAGLTAPQFLFDGANLITRAELAGGKEGVYSLAGHTNGDIFMYAFCNSVEAQCAAGQSLEWDWSYSKIFWADIDLSNNATPTGTGFAGTVVESGHPLTGQASLTFSAHDEGTGASGVYRVSASLDGDAIYEATPDTNGGACVALPANQVGIMEFASAHPCRTTESVTIPVATADVKDGAHELVITVTDAAGNTAIVYAHVIQTDNAPAVTTEPVVTGVATVGATLTATPATFSAPTGAGSVTVAETWLRCTDASGSHCSPLPGAAGSTYSPTSGDGGYYLEYANTATDNDGSTTAASQPTLAVTDPAHENPGSGGGPGGPGGAGGSGGGSSGGSGGAAGAAGSGGVGAGALTVNLTGPPTAQAVLGSLAPWLINLKASRVRVHRGQTVVFSGVVESSPRPPSGKLIDLEARTVTVRYRGSRRRRRARTVYGPWLTFAAPRAKANGAYRVSHLFKLGGRHTYQFEAIAPRESGYINATGRSRIVTVNERPKR